MNRPKHNNAMDHHPIKARLKVVRPGFTLDIDLQLPGRGVTALFGPSGCGKTTCLRAIAGLTRANPGHVVVNAEVWQDDAQALWLAPHERALGYVFQEASLFPHLNVRKNIEYGMKRLPADQRRVALEHAVELLGIGALMEQNPDTLSGGERQRVAIARALVTRPACVLADEPTGNLDRNTADGVFDLMLQLARDQGTAFVVVTHDEALAARCSRRVRLVRGVLSEG